MQIEYFIPTILLLAGLVNAQGCNFCGAGCPAGQACKSFDISQIFTNGGVDLILDLDGIPIPTVPAGTTILVRFFSHDHLPSGSFHGSHRVVLVIELIARPHSTRH